MRRDRCRILARPRRLEGSASDHDVVGVRGRPAATPPRLTAVPAVPSRILLSTPSLTVGAWHCPLSRRGAGPEETVAGVELSLQRTGAHLREGDEGAVAADPLAVVVQPPARRFRLRRALAQPECGTTITFASGALAAALGSDHLPPEGDGAHAVALARPAGLLHAALLQELAGEADPLRAEALALAFAREVLVGGRRLPGVDGRAPARGELVARVRAILAAGYGTRLTLADVAASAGASVFHLSRVFREETGVPIHRHLVRVRLHAALERLRDAGGAGETLSRVALDVGFSSHSHLTSAFRREFGVPPRRVRGALE